MKLLLSQCLQVILPSGDALGLAPRDAAVLAWLALEGPTPRARLAALLWPDSDAGAARRSLRQRLHHLRKGAGDGLLEGDDTLSLAEGVSHDLHESDTVLGHDAHDFSPAFVAWLARQRQDRQNRMRRALSEFAEMAEQARDHADALVHAHELLALDPRSEAAHRRVIRLHYLRGDRAAALLAFDRCEQVLKDEVGTAPSAETLALLATIERAEPDSALQPVVAVPAALQRPPRLIGRDTERQALVRAVDDAAVLLLSGPAGMGKSRLIADLVGDDATRFSVVSARPGDLSAPYAVAARWLRDLMLRGVQANTAQRRALASVLPGFGPAPEHRREEDRTHLIDSVGSLLEAAVQLGLRAVVVDDLQFADAASVELLHALAGSTPCAWILAMRPDELGPAALALVDAQGRSTRASTVALQPLDVETIAVLLDSLAIEGIGGPAQAGELHQRTGGNPMFLLETLKAALVARPKAAGAVPWPRVETVQRLIQQRLKRLDPMALKLARCAALAGQDFSPSLAAEVLRLQPLDLADAWGRLEEAQVLRDGSFAHDLIAEAAQALVPQPIAHALHAEIGRILERAGGEPARIAAHWLAAGERGNAVAHLSEAGRRAERAWQRTEAAAFHAQAAAILRDAGDRRGAFDAYFAAVVAAIEGNNHGDGAVFREALQALADDDGQRAMVAWSGARQLRDQGQFDASHALVLETLPLVQRSDLPEIEVELLWLLATEHLNRYELDETMACLERALARLADVDPAAARLTQVGRRYQLVKTLAWTLTIAGRYAECDAMLEPALHDARREGAWAYIAPISCSLAVNALEQGRLEQSCGWFAEAVADLDRFDGGMLARMEAYGGRAQALGFAGDLGGALAAAEAGVAVCTKPMPRNEPFVRKRLHWLQYEFGRPDLALKGLRALHARDDLPPDEVATIEADLIRLGEPLDSAALIRLTRSFNILQPRARILCAIQQQCDPLLILPALCAEVDVAARLGAHAFWLTLQTRRVSALRQLGRTDEAREIALAVWQRVEEGVTGFEMFPHMAADLSAALAPSHADLAQVIALRASAWMQRAAATLPTEWRRSYLSRAPVLRNLPPVGFA